MNEKTKVITGSIALTTGAYFSALVALLISILLTRHLTKEMYGMYVFIISFASICYIFTNIGIDNISNYFIQRYKDRDLSIVKYIIYLGVKLKVILFLIIVFALIWLGLSDIKYYYVALFFIFFVPNQYLKTFLISFQHFRLYGQLQILESLGKLLLLVLLLYLTTPPLSWIILAVGLPMIIISLIAANDVRGTLPKFKPSIKFGKVRGELLHYWKWLVIASIMPPLTGNIMQVTLGLIDELEELAIFGVGYALSNIVLIMYTSFRGAMQTSFVKKTDIESIGYSLTDSIRYMLIIALFLIPFFHFVSSPLVVTFYTRKYVDAAIILEILVYRVLIEMVFAGLNPAALAIGKPNLRVMAETVNIATIAISAIFLVPNYRAVGAALSLSFGSLMRTLSFAAAEYKYVKYKFPLITLVKCVISATIVSAVFYSIKLSNIYAIFFGLLCAGIYVFILYVVKEIKKEDIHLIRDSVMLILNYLKKIVVRNREQ